MYVIRITKDKGRAVFANSIISSGTIVCDCEILVFDPVETVLINTKTKLKYYSFIYDDSRDCLVLGDGEIFNHSDQANLSYELIEVTENDMSRHIMRFKSIRDILVDEELTIDYSADVDTIDTSEYIYTMIG